MDNHRYYGLDALRGGMMVLGIVLHGAVFYLAAPVPAMPIPTDRNNSYAFDLLFHFIHSFRMPAFFVLAGFFAALLVARRGLLGAASNRAARVLAPLLVAVLTVLPLSALLMIDFFLSVRFGTHDLLPDLRQLQTLGREMKAAGAPVGEIGLGHLWFLYYLCWFYLLLPLCRWLATQGRVAALASGALASPQGLLWLVAWTSVTLWPFRGGQVHEGFLMLRPHVPSLLYYGSFFVLGYALQSWPGTLQRLALQVPRLAALALPLFALSMFASHAEHLAAEVTPAIHACAVLSNALCTWVLVRLCIGCAMRWGDRASPWSLYLSQSSYWVFLAHLPILTLVAWWLQPHDLPAALKFSIGVGITTVACFLSYHYLVQNSWISVFLNGQRFQRNWPWRAAPAPLPA